MKFGGFFIALAFVLAACSSDPQPREPDPNPTASTAQPSPTATAPTMPAQASEDSPEGAAAFVSYWVQVSNYAAATGDVTELSRISSPDCSGCQKYIDLYRDTYEAGGYFKGGEWELGELVLKPGSPTLVFAPLSSDIGRFKLDEDSDEKAGEPEDSKLTFIVSRSNKLWTLTALELQAPS